MSNSALPLSDHEQIASVFSKRFEEIGRHIALDVDTLMRTDPLIVAHDPMRRLTIPKKNAAVKATDYLGRRIILLRTSLGNVVLFEPIAHSTPATISLIAPKAILAQEKIQNPQQLTSREVERFLGKRYFPCPPHTVYANQKTTTS